MKRLLLVLAFTLLPLVAHGGIRITLNVTANPSAYLSDWTQRKETVILTIVNSDTREYQVRLGAKISTGGVLQAETNIEKVPVFTVRPGISTFYGEDLVPASAVNFVGDVDKTVIRSGRLPSGSYLFCVQVFDADTRAPLSEDRCRQFTVRNYLTPRLLSPEDRAKTPPPFIRQAFQWTAVAPQYSPRQQYEIRVMEVLAGQTPTQAFRANRPILDRTVRAATRLVWPSDVAIDTPMAYVWSVRALDDAGNPLGDTKDGWAEPWSFTLGESAIQPPRLISPVDMATFSPPRLDGLRWAAIPFGSASQQEYQIRVVPVGDGETPERAFRVNRPILERSLRGATFLAWPNDLQIDTPMAYVWSVRALDKAGNPLGEGDGGWATPWRFTIGSGGGTGRSVGAGSTEPDSGAPPVTVILHRPPPTGMHPDGSSGADSGVRVTLNVTSYPPPYLSDWTSPRETISLTVDNGSTTEQSVDIRIESGERVKVTNDREKSLPKIVTVPPGITTFYGEDLVPAVIRTFYGEDLVPAATAPDDEKPGQVVRSGRLPSGNYRLAATLYDPLTGRPISDPSYASFTIKDDAALFAAVRAEGIAAVMFVSSGTDCSSAGQGCVDIFPKDQPSERWLAAMKKDRVATLRSTWNGHVKLLPREEKSDDADTRSLENDTLPRMRATSGSVDTDATAMDSVYGRPIDDGLKRTPLGDSSFELTFELAAPDEGPDSSVRLDAPAALSAELCKVFGIDTAKIPKGEYRMTKAPGSNGSLEFPTANINVSRSNIKRPPPR